MSRLIVTPDILASLDVSSAVYCACCSEELDGPHAATCLGCDAPGLLCDRCFRTHSRLPPPPKLAGHYFVRAPLEMPAEAPEPPRPPESSETRFKTLVAKIAAGNCVAFLGAGFLAPIGGAFCSWVTLLRKTVLISLADERAEKLMEPLPGEPGSEEGETWGLPRHQRLRKALLGMLEQPQDAPGAAVDGHKLLAIAQHIENAVGTRQLQEDLQALLKLPGPGDPPPDGAKPEWRKQLNRRIALLRGIPFRAILTTNFTDVFGYGQELTGGAQDLVTALRGRVEAEEAFRSSLEAIDDRSAHTTDREVSLLRCIMDPSGGADELPVYDKTSDAAVLHLHGKDSPVISKQGYRRLLHRTAGYQPFVTTLLATSTVCYFGFSFTDDYLTALQSEVISMMVPEGRPVPLLGVGLLHQSAAPADLVASRRREDGLGLIPFAQYDFCDQFLEVLYEFTSMPCRLGRLLAGAKVIFSVFEADGGVGRERGWKEKPETRPETWRPGQSAEFREYDEARRMASLAWAAVKSDWPGRAAYMHARAAVEHCHAEFIGAPNDVIAARWGGVHPAVSLPLPAARGPDGFPVAGPRSSGYIKVCYGRAALLEAVPPMRTIPPPGAEGAVLNSITPSPCAVSADPPLSAYADVLVTNYGDVARKPPYAAYTGGLSELGSVMRIVQGLPQEGRCPVVVFGVMARELRLAECLDLGAAGYEMAAPGLLVTLTQILEAQDLKRRNDEQRARQALHAGRRASAATAAPPPLSSNSSCDAAFAAASPPSPLPPTFSHASSVDVGSASAAAGGVPVLTLTGMQWPAGIPTQQGLLARR